MDRAQLSQFEQDLQKAKNNDAEFNRIRNALLKGLAEGHTTREGESQHQKLQNIEMAIRNNLEVKHDLEVILASHGKL